MNEARKSQFPPSRHRCTRLLRYRVDVISILVVVVAICLQVLAVCAGLPWYVVFLILVLLREVNLVEHNHSHLRMFYSNALNELLGWMCFVSNGIALEIYDTHHTKNHHKYNMRWSDERVKGRDWSSLYGFQGAEYPRVPVGRLYYVATFPVIAMCHCLLEILRRPGSRMFRRYVRSCLVLAVCTTALVLVDPIGFLWFFLLPWVVVHFAVASNNYDHHVGCTVEDPTQSATVRTGIYYTVLGFNIGYHVSHHMKPGLHWSLLPQLHEEIAHRIPAKNFHPAKTERPSFDPIPGPVLRAGAVAGGARRCPRTSRRGC